MAKSYDPFIRIADNIGSYICANAFWAGSRCSWIGRAEEDGTPLINKALGPEIYDGTSGIAYFLSCLCDNANKEAFWTTAEGAINHSLSHIGEIPSVSRFGFYDGCIGIAYVAAKMALRKDNSTLLDTATSIFRNLSKDTQTKHYMDIMSGNAGAIPALLEIYDILHDQSLYELAVNLGNELLQFAVKGRSGWSWDYRSNGVESAQHNLTGFSHGAAGFAYSLLELFRKTDDHKYRLAAEEGFKYENRWFNKTLNNWPDFRKTEEGIRKKNQETLSYGTSWCHGAPGICLSRIRAYQILQDERYLNDCHAALSTVIELMSGRGNIDLDNYSQCHGLGGNCEPLIHAYETFNDKSYKSIAFDVGDYGIEKYGNQIFRWPCGSETGQTPGLMLGLAGIGHFYLRLYDSKHTPSITML